MNQPLGAHPHPLSLKTCFSAVTEPAVGLFNRFNSFPFPNPACVDTYGLQPGEHAPEPAPTDEAIKSPPLKTDYWLLITDYFLLPAASCARLLLFSLLFLTITASAQSLDREQIRSSLIQGRRLICGRVLQVLPEGLVVDSGYTNLLRHPLTQSWVAPSTVSADRPSNLVEGGEPGAVCVGLVFLTDIPKRPPVRQYDFVLIQGYPAGNYSYTSVPPITRTIRKFAAGLETAVRLKSPADASSRPYGLPSRPNAKPYLSMPDRADGAMPPLLSQTGAFEETKSLSPNSSLIPYDLAVPFWSDGGGKARWISVPTESPGGVQKIKFTPTGEWSFPKGTVFVKHFELVTNETHPDLKRRLETRLVVCDSTGSVYGVTYKWRADNSDADLLATNLSEQILIQTASGVRTQKWYYPSRQDCRTCHTDKAGGILGVKTRQLNGPFKYPSGVTDNQLRAWSHAGLFDSGCEEEKLATYPALARADDSTHSLEDRARSYLDANCAHCHRPGGTVANFDARYDTPLERQLLIGGPILINEGLDNARAIAPKDIWRSVIYARASSLDGLKMPPLAHEVLDTKSLALLRQWIESLPGTPVLPPPTISPGGGHFSQPVEVTLTTPEPGATIHYTTDGSAPAKSDPPYEKPIKLTEPTVLRARVFKAGFTKSITVQDVFVVGE
jgi:uncharacterized repeat protein (TIGR03806 family)